MSRMSVSRKLASASARLLANTVSAAASTTAIRPAVPSTPVTQQSVASGRSRLSRRAPIVWSSSPSRARTWTSRPRASLTSTLETSWHSPPNSASGSSWTCSTSWPTNTDAAMTPTMTRTTRMPPTIRHARRQPLLPGAGRSHSTWAEGDATPHSAGTSSGATHPCGGGVPDDGPHVRDPTCGASGGGGGGVVPPDGAGGGGGAPPVPVPRSSSTHIPPVSPHAPGHSGHGCAVALAVPGHAVGVVVRHRPEIARRRLPLERRAPRRSSSVVEQGTHRPFRRNGVRPRFGSGGRQHPHPALLGAAQTRISDPRSGGLWSGVAGPTLAQLRGGDDARPPSLAARVALSHWRTRPRPMEVAP